MPPKTSRTAADHIPTLLGLRTDRVPALGPRHEYIRSTPVVATEVCARKGLFVRLNLRPLRRSAGMDEGSLAHCALAVLARTGDAQRANNATIIAANGLINEASKHATAFDDNTVIAEEVGRRRAIGMACAVRLWEKLKVSLDSGALTIIAVEEPQIDKFSEIGTYSVGMDVRVRCQFDVIVRDAQGFLWPLNWKTEGSDVQSAILGYRHSIQGFLDVQGLKDWDSRPETVKITDGTAGVPGALWAVIQKPGIRRKAVGRPTEEPMSKFIDRCGNWWDGTGEYAPKAGKAAKAATCLLHRETIPNKGPRVGEFLRRLCKYIAIMEAPPVLRHFPVVEGACRMGPFTCPYRPICTADPSRWNLVCREKFTQAPDPLDSDPSRTAPVPPMEE